MRTLASETVKKIGSEVTLKGWINSRRDHGKIMFLDLRDRSGVVQLVGTKQLGDARPEDVVEVTGLVKERPESMINPKLVTGAIEIEIQKLTILSKSHELPLPIDTDGHEISEEVRLKYRYLDLRRPRLQRNIRLRSQFVDLVRQYLFSHDFTEIETPMLTKSTPEGSRDFLVPARLQPGKFYALPQSPQQYKQLLMVAGFERYFQIARCMRDEDLRADRGFEHSQIDIEMSFVTREDVMKMDESLMIHVVEAMGYTVKEKPFPVFTYKQAMEQFGADKFDLRTDEDKKNGVLAFAWVTEFPFFEKVENNIGNATRSSSEQSEVWTFSHNPFSSPEPEHKEWLLKKERIGEIITQQYDLVCNGYEVGGGSIRSHEPEILRAVFEVMGYSKERIDAEFGHMLEAFTYGAPPHGGLAHGIERLLMIITGEPYLREVVAFPQTSRGTTSIMDAPSTVTREQLEELGISLRGLNSQQDVYDAIVASIKSEGVHYTTFEHEPVLTSEDAARVRKTELHTGAKALLMYADGKPVMLTVPGDKKADIKKFKTAFNFKDIRMATPEEVLKVTHVPVGAVPPFGHIFGIPLYMDLSLRDGKTVVFNAGFHTKSISLLESDYEKVVRPVTGEFSKNSVE